MEHELAGVLRRFLNPALRTNAEEFEFVRDLREPVPCRERGFEFRRKTILDLHHR